MVDTGADENVLAEEDWKQLKRTGFEAHVVRKGSKKIFNAYGSPIPLEVLGEVDAEISINGTSIETTFYVIAGGKCSLLSGDAAISLGIIKFTYTVGQDSFPSIKALFHLFTTLFLFHPTPTPVPLFPAPTTPCSHPTSPVPTPCSPLFPAPAPVPAHPVPVQPLFPPTHPLPPVPSPTTCSQPPSPHLFPSPSTCSTPPLFPPVPTPLFPVQPHLSPPQPLSVPTPALFPVPPTLHCPCSHSPPPVLFSPCSHPTSLFPPLFQPHLLFTPPTPPTPSSCSLFCSCSTCSPALFHSPVPTPPLFPASAPCSQLPPPTSLFPPVPQLSPSPSPSPQLPLQLSPQSVPPPQPPPTSPCSPTQLQSVPQPTPPHLFHPPCSCSTPPAPPHPCSPHQPHSCSTPPVQPHLSAPPLFCSHHVPTTTPVPLLFPPQFPLFPVPVPHSQPSTLFQFTTPPHLFSCSHLFPLFPASPVPSSCSCFPPLFSPHLLPVHSQQPCSSLLSSSCSPSSF
ncbi:uncharacterized protein LOC134206010 [Armigeres subalbatus]|uniref:uncharacterized protein LOC134206010 n=1 Tax=Armigeres subalbatus TaxID=124917 RepID=UPI002ED41C24